MSFAAPLWIAIAGVVAAGVVLAHLFRRTVPPQDVLPTVRFVPEGSPVAVLRSRRLSDVALLLLRLSVVALLGLALAGAHVPRRAPQSVVVIDASRAVRSMRDVIDSALAASYSGGEFIVFDSTARRVPRESVRGLSVTTTRGSLSAALVVANRLVAGSRDGGAWTQLVIVSPLARESVDSAVTPLIDLWPGPLRVIRVSAATQAPAASWEIRATGDDPVAAALGGAPRGRGPATVRVVRGVVTSADSQWAVSGGALVVWPVSPATRAVSDTQGGIATVGNGNVTVASFARRTRPTPGAAPVRWADGEPAATERAVGRGCIRDVTIPVDGVGDLALRASFRGIARTLIEPCGGARDFGPASLPAREGVILSRDAAKNLAVAGSWPLWFALIGAGLLIAEQFVRRERAAA